MLVGPGTPPNHPDPDYIPDDDYVVPETTAEIERRRTWMHQNPNA